MSIGRAVAIAVAVQGAKSTTANPHQSKPLQKITA